MNYLFAYAYWPPKKYLEVAVLDETHSNSLTNLVISTEQLLAAIPFRHYFKVEPWVRVWRKNLLKQKDDLDEIVYPGQPVLSIEMTIVPRIAMHEALSALNLKGFIRRGYSGKLYPGMYGDARHPIINYFGLQSGQTRETRLVHNGGWYDKNGELLARGDLDYQDFLHVAQGINNGEFFLITGEQYSNQKSPGLDYVLKHIDYAIGRGECLNIIDAPLGDEESKKKKFNEVEFIVVDREKFIGQIKERLKQKSI
jgi:hypothetical protein